MEKIDTMLNKRFHGFFCHLESGQPIWNAHSNCMGNAVKLSSQVCVAQSFQVNIWYYAHVIFFPESKVPGDSGDSPWEIAGLHTHRLPEAWGNFVCFISGSPHEWGLTALFCMRDKSAGIQVKCAENFCHHILWYTVCTVYLDVPGN